ncbi:hypothetical protein M3Y96_01137900 [Aphelenchoides besseyi]|nr:hypothetical protein M3Y96_01137900 [Aphelenchoides besseyi]
MTDDAASGIPNSQMIWISVIFFFLLTFIVVIGFLSSFLTRWAYKQKINEKLAEMEEKREKEEQANQRADLSSKLTSLLNLMQNQRKDNAMMKSAPQQSESTQQLPLRSIMVKQKQPSIDYTTSTGPESLNLHSSAVMKSTTPMVTTSSLPVRTTESGVYEPQKKTPVSLFPTTSAQTDTLTSEPQRPEQSIASKSAISTTTETSETTLDETTISTTNSGTKMIVKKKTSKGEVMEMLKKSEEERAVNNKNAVHMPNKTAHYQDVTFVPQRQKATEVQLNKEIDVHPTTMGCYVHNLAKHHKPHREDVILIPPSSSPTFSDYTTASTSAESYKELSASYPTSNNRIGSMTLESIGKSLYYHSN